MEKIELERKLKALEEENKRLKAKTALQDTQITKLIQELQESEKNFESLSIFSSIYETNSHYDDINANLEVSLTDIAINLGAKGVVLFQKQDNQEFKGTNTSLNYLADNPHKKDDDILTFMQALELRGEFPELVSDLENIQKYGCRIIQVNNMGEKSAICKSTNIDSVTFVQIITDQEVRYLLGIINPQKQLDNYILELISIAYGDTLKRIEHENLTHTLSITDNMTGVYNRRYYNTFKDSISNQGVSSIGVILADLFRLKYVNDTFGHEAGDIYIKAMANLLIKYFKNDRIFRLGGDEFVIIVIDKDYKYIEDHIAALEEEIAALELTDAYGNKIFARIDTGIEYAYGDFNFTELIHNADLRMNENKNRYYRESGIDRRK